MTTAILLPAMGDPYLMGCWLTQYERILRGITDNTYIVMTSSIDKEIMEYTAARARDLGITVFTKPHSDTHGNNIRFLLEQCREDYVALLEDDIFLFNSNLIAGSFDTLLNGRADVVGSTRCSATDNIRDATVQKFNLLEHPESKRFQLDSCPFLWPGPLFTKRDILLSTDKHFDPIAWEPGQYINQIDLQLADQARGDTFVWTSIQLRAMGCRISYFSHPHSHPDDRRYALGAIPPKHPWIHYGSLSSGIMGLLKDSNSMSLGEREIQNVSQYIQKHDSLKQELSRRLAFFRILLEYYPLPPPLDYFNEIYSHAIDDAIAHFELSRGEVDIYCRAIKIMFSDMLA